MNAPFNALALTSSAEFKATKRMLEFHSDGGPDKLSATSLTQARTPTVAVDRARDIVPVRARFRLKDLLAVDLDAGTFRASIYLELEWMERDTEPQPAGRPGSPTSGGHKEVDHPSQPAFDPQLTFDNLIEDVSLKDGTAQMKDTELSVKDLRGYWHGIIDSDDPSAFSVRRHVWNGVGVFSIDPADTADAPFSPINLRIQVSCNYRSTTINGAEEIVQPEPLPGRVEFSFVDLGTAMSKSTLGTADLGIDEGQRFAAALGVAPGSFALKETIKNNFTLSESYNYDDAPSLEVALTYRSTQRPFSPFWVLPSCLVGMVSPLLLLSSGLEREMRLEVSVICLISLALLSLAPNFAAAGRSAVLAPNGTAQSAMQWTLLGYVAVAFLQVALDATGLLLGNGEGAIDGETASNTSEAISQRRLIAVALLAALWLVPTVVLVCTRTAVLLLSRCCCCSRRQYGGAVGAAAAGIEHTAPLSGAVVEMVASTLHTKWRADRLREFNGAMVPRWKQIGPEEAAEWQATFTEKELKDLRGIVFEQVPIAPQDQKAWLANLQECADKRAQADMPASSQAPESV